MDPIQLTTENWEATRLSLNILGLLVLFAIVSGSSLILAHAIIPSAVSTNTLPSGRSMNLVRRGAYVAGVVCLVGVVVCIVAFLVSLGWLFDVYPSFWQ